MRTIHIQPKGRDLLEIWQYIAQNNFGAANRVEAELDQAIQSLAEMPGKGHRRADVKNPAYRFWTVYSYVIVYKYDDSTITVVRIVHGAHDFRTLFP